MKVYKANKELEGTLISQGFIDTTPEDEKKKGKRRFRLSHKAKNEIFFNYINIELIDPYSIIDSRIEITESELKALILYFNLSNADFKIFSSTRNLTLKQMQERLENLYKEQEALKRFGSNGSRLEHVSRILGIYESINI